MPKFFKVNWSQNISRNEMNWKPPKIFHTTFKFQNLQYRTVHGRLLLVGSRYTSVADLDEDLFGWILIWIWTFGTESIWIQGHKNKKNLHFSPFFNWQVLWIHMCELSNINFISWKATVLLKQISRWKKLVKILYILYRIRRRRGNDWFEMSDPDNNRLDP
jgi:hypothetical protein